MRGNVRIFEFIECHKTTRLRVRRGSRPFLRTCTSAVRFGAGAVYYPNCIIARCLHGYIVSRGVFAMERFAARTQSNGLIALSTQLRNCLQFTISQRGRRGTLRPRLINFMNGRAHADNAFSLQLSRWYINQRACLPRDKHTVTIDAG